MTTDARGVPVSTSDSSALAVYEQALLQVQTYVGDPVATIDRALAAAPDFVLGHAFRAAVLMTFSEHRFATQARASAATAEGLLAGANDRERALVVACRHLVDGEWDTACAALDRVLVDYPRDILAIQIAHLFDFFRGDALNLRNRITRVLPHWTADVPGYSYLLGMHAFGLEECNQYPEASETASRALAIEPRDAWAVHAGVHVREMQGQIDEGINWLASRERDWAPDNGFAYHNWWHLALFHLDRGDIPRVLDVLDRAIYPERSDLSLQLVDASALLWRLHVLGADVRPRLAALADVWESKLDEERGFYAFNDVHAMMAFAGAGREAAAARLLRDMEATSTGTSLNAAMIRDVGLPVARGFLAFERGRYDDAIGELERTRDRANTFGGSHAQRDILTITLVEAALRAGRNNVARHYLAERTVHRPASALGRRLLERARA